MVRRAGCAGEPEWICHLSLVPPRGIMRRDPLRMFICRYAGAVVAVQDGFMKVGLGTEVPGPQHSGEYAYWLIPVPSPGRLSSAPHPPRTGSTATASTGYCSVRSGPIRTEADSPGGVLPCHEGRTTSSRAARTPSVRVSPQVQPGRAVLQTVQSRQKGWPSGSAYTRQSAPSPGSRRAPSAST